MSEVSEMMLFCQSADIETVVRGRSMTQESVVGVNRLGEDCWVEN